MITFSPLLIIFLISIIHLILGGKGIYQLESFFIHYAMIAPTIDWTTTILVVKRTRIGLHTANVVLKNSFADEIYIAQILF